jgi:hypothetical protein
MYQDVASIHIPERGILAKNRIAPFEQSPENQNEPHFWENSPRSSNDQSRRNEEAWFRTREFFTVMTW